MSDYNKFKSASQKAPTFSNRRTRHSKSPEEDYRRDQRSSRRNTRSPMKDRRDESIYRRSNSSNKSRNSRSDSRSRSRSPIQRKPQFMPGNVPPKSGNCFNCGEHGHFKTECPVNNSRNRREHTFDRSEGSYKNYDSRNSRERNIEYSRNNDSRDRAYRQPLKKPERHQTNDPGINASNRTRNEYGYRLEEKPCQSTTKESFKAPKYNAHNETRAAIMAMMESMSQNQTSMTCEPRGKTLNEKKSKDKYFDENDNFCNKTEARSGSEDHDKIVLEIIDSLISNFINIISGAPRDKVSAYDEGESSGKETSTPITQCVREAELYETSKTCRSQNKNTNEDQKERSTDHENSFCEKIARKMPPLESPDNKQALIKQSISEGQNPTDPRNKKDTRETEIPNLLIDHHKVSSATDPSMRGRPLKEQLLSQGVPENAFSQNDGFKKMQIVFCGRVGVVKKQPLNICQQVAECMIECCEHVFHGYHQLADQYVNARIEHIQRSRHTGFFPEENVSEADMSTLPPLLELRQEWHRQIINVIGKQTKVPFRYSELVDLVMYYFNHIAWNECRTKPWKQGHY